MSSPRFPRFAFEKFPGAEPLLTTAMKSVGEAMAIGRTFGESIQKALRSLETGLTGFDETPLLADKTAIPPPPWPAPTPDRLPERGAGDAARLSAGRNPEDHRL